MKSVESPRYPDWWLERCSGIYKYVALALLLRLLAGIAAVGTPVMADALGMELPGLIGFVYGRMIARPFILAGDGLLILSGLTALTLLRVQWNWWIAMLLTPLLRIPYLYLVFVPHPFRDLEWARFLSELWFNLAILIPPLLSTLRWFLFTRKSYTHPEVRKVAAH